MATCVSVNHTINDKETRHSFLAGSVEEADFAAQVYIIIMLLRYAYSRSRDQ